MLWVLKNRDGRHIQHQKTALSRGGAPVKLTIQQSYELFAKHGAFTNECCDRCGLLLGAVRFTRENDLGAWCSPQCRGDIQQHRIPQRRSSTEISN